MAISKGAVKEMLNKYLLHTWIYMQFCSFQLYTTVKIKFIHGKDSVTLPKKSFQSLHNAKGLFNNMQKFNRLPYLQPHVQSCGFTKKINSESWDCLTMCKNFLIFNPMCKVVTLQKIISGFWDCLTICKNCLIFNHMCKVVGCGNKAECASCSAVYFIFDILQHSRWFWLVPCSFTFDLAA